jgi:hypothetical protein
MAGYFKKRRGSQGPSKNEEKLIRAKRNENAARLAGVLRSRFPAIQRLRIHLTFLDGQRVLDEKDLSLGPLEAAVFSVPCPGRCGRGVFDFGSKIAETVNAMLPLSESSAKCSALLYAASPVPCGCEIRCRMEIDYFPVEESPAAASCPDVAD